MLAAAFRSVGRGAASVLLMFAVVAAGSLAGCGGQKTVKAPPGVAPPATYTGPAFLRGTVGSMVSLRPGTDQPLLVSSYGVVVFPPGTGTGSSEVPAFLRQRLIQEMRKKGLGSARLAAQFPPELQPFFNLSPERFLDSSDTAVVAVQGLIPPGAVKGRRFDVLVSAVDTQTTSLAGGTLWTLDLGVGGTAPGVEFTRPLATAGGPVYIDPLDPRSAEEKKQDIRRQGVVVLGGEVQQAREVEIILNQPSWTRSRLIADRINERFGRSSDREPIAQPQTDLRIIVRIPDRWAAEPELLLSLVGHLYVQRGAGFEEAQARRLVEELRAAPELAGSVVAAWRALGKGTLEVLRELYGDPSMPLRVAALEAGAWLGDERASRYLDALANDGDPLIRARAAQALVYLPSSLQGARTLRRLLDDEDTAVRIAAYESLAKINDTSILRRVAIGDPRHPKYLIDQVPGERPLVYITQQSFPRIAVFGGDIRFDRPMVAGLWDSSLVLRVEGEDQPMELFYQPPRRIEAIKHRLYPPSLAMFAYVLGHTPHERDLQEGLGLGYTQAVDAINTLVREGYVRAPIEFNLSELAQRVEEIEKVPSFRPETGEDAERQGEQAMMPAANARPETATP